MSHRTLYHESDITRQIDFRALSQKSRKNKSHSTSFHLSSASKKSSSSTSNPKKSSSKNKDSSKTTIIHDLRDVIINSTNAASSHQTTSSDPAKNKVLALINNTKSSKPVNYEKVSASAVAAAAHKSKEFSRSRSKDRRKHQVLVRNLPDNFRKSEFHDLLRPFNLKWYKTELRSNRQNQLEGIIEFEESRQMKQVQATLDGVKLDRHHRLEVINMNYVTDSHDRYANENHSREKSRDRNDRSSDEHRDNKENYPRRSRREILEITRRKTSYDKHGRLLDEKENRRYYDRSKSEKSSHRRSTYDELYDQENFETGLTIDKHGRKVLKKERPYPEDVNLKYDVDVYEKIMAAKKRAKDQSQESGSKVQHEIIYEDDLINATGEREVNSSSVETDFEFKSVSDPENMQPEMSVPIPLVVPEPVVKKLKKKTKKLAKKKAKKINYSDSSENASKSISINDEDLSESISISLDGSSSVTGSETSYNPNLTLEMPDTSNLLNKPSADTPFGSKVEDESATVPKPQAAEPKVKVPEQPVESSESDNGLSYMPQKMGKNQLRKMAELESELAPKPEAITAATVSSESSEDAYQPKLRKPSGGHVKAPTLAEMEARLKKNNFAAGRDRSKPPSRNITPIIDESEIKKNLELQQDIEEGESELEKIRQQIQVKKQRKELEEKKKKIEEEKLLLLQEMNALESDINPVLQPKEELEPVDLGLNLQKPDSNLASEKNSIDEFGETLGLAKPKEEVEEPEITPKKPKRNMPSVRHRGFEELDLNLNASPDTTDLDLENLSKSFKSSAKLTPTQPKKSKKHHKKSKESISSESDFNSNQAGSYNPDFHDTKDPSMKKRKQIPAEERISDPSKSGQEVENLYKNLQILHKKLMQIDQHWNGLNF